MDNLYGFTPTNTFGFATFDVLKTDAIEDPLINVNKLATMDLEECYFVSAVKFINEMNNEFTSSKITLYEKISEATSYGVVHESFSDFFVKVKEIIDKFLKFLKSLFQRFITTLNKLIGSEKYLEKHKKDFSNFKDEDKFKFEGFKYTFNENIPRPNALLDYNVDLFDGLFGDNKYNLDVNGIKAAGSSIGDLEDFYCKFRADVLGKDGDKIYSTDYSDELFKIFRDDETITSTIEVDRSYIREVIDRFFKYKKNNEYTNKQYKEIENAYKKVEDQIKDLVKRNGDLNGKAFITKLPDGAAIHTIDNTNPESYKMSGEIMAQLDIYVKIKVEQIQECSNIHTLAYAAKLDALKECAKQDKITLYTALSRIQRTDTKRSKEDY